MRLLAHGFHQLEAVFTRHHHVENEQIEIEADELAARILRALRRRHAIALALQEA